tara:strand:+ start:393 stop:707 length:315 start_codon:yes stop_codon:yes gene_type:complete
MTKLSEQTIGKLADTLVEDVIDYITADDRLQDFYLELIGDAVCQKLGNKNPDGSCTFDGTISADLIMEIANRIMLISTPDVKYRNTGGFNDILSYFKSKKKPTS